MRRSIRKTTSITLINGLIAINPTNVWSETPAISEPRNTVITSHQASVLCHPEKDPKIIEALLAPLSYWNLRDSRISTQCKQAIETKERKFRLGESYVVERKSDSDFRAKLSTLDVVLKRTPATGTQEYNGAGATFAFNNSNSKRRISIETLRGFVSTQSSNSE